MPLSVSEFVTRWKLAALKESAAAQSHFIDLCDMLGKSHPAAEDSVGDRYTFEKQVNKLRAGDKGFADVWMRDHFAWEYKGKHKDLHKAYLQLADYREDLGNPPLLVVCDLNRFEIHTNFTSTTKRVYSFNLDDLQRNVVTATCPIPPLDVLRALFDDTSALRPERTAARVTEDAAKKFLRIAERLELEPRTEKPTKQQIAHFLMRLVFCLFADSVGLLPDHVFRELVRFHRTRPRKFRRKLTDLFEAMSSPDPDERYFGEHDILYFNGGLFNDSATLELNEGDMGILYDAAANLDWSHIEPAIFGTLFERSLDADKRSLIGAHYTSSADILLLIEPVVMQPLRRRWVEVKQKIVEALDTERQGTAASAAEIEAELLKSGGLSRRDESSSSPAKTRSPKSTKPYQATLRARGKAEELLSTWLDELTAVTVLDPACGSGNFLYIALQQLLDLWKEAKDFALDQGLAVVRQGKVSPRQLFGIETDFYAHELASMVVWIGYLQWMHQHGEPIVDEPILERLDNIEKGDAILRYNEEGKPSEPTWPKADYIVGNPPFLGGKFLRRELGDTYIDDLFRIYKDRVKAEADLVVYWFEKARAQLEQDKVLSAGLLATQGIRGGANRQTLQRIQLTGRIFYAWSDREWTLAGAAVHVSMIAFTKSEEPPPMLDGQPVTTINADLSLGIDIPSAKCLPENANLCFMGTTKVGAFDIPSHVASRMLAAPLNPNGRPNSDVVKRWVNASDITGRDRGMFIIDFGTSMPESAAALYEMPFEYIRQHVKPTRLGNKRDVYGKRWWLHGESRPELRAALKQLAQSAKLVAYEAALSEPRYIVTPRVSKYRLFSYINADVLPDSATFAFARDDDYFFGVLHSRVHELWSRAQGTQLREVESGFRYTPKTTFDTFPFPWSPGKEPVEDSLVQYIAAAAKTLVELRDRWLNPPDTPEADLKKRTLTNLYNAKPQWLQDAHRTLDEAVFAAYGWPTDLTDQQILERLLALNYVRAKP